MNDPLKDLQRLDDMEPEHIHGEHFIVLWELTREPESRRDDLERVAQDCIDLANVGVDCLKKGRPHLAIRKFINAFWNDRSVDTMARVFKAYVDTGIIDVDQALDGELALAGAILNGNIHTAEHLVLHGASTVGQDGQCLIDLARTHFGRDSIFKAPPEDQEKAAARLLAASLKHQIQDRLIEAPKDQLASPPKTRQRLGAL
ncbi:hypothetical protein [Paucibacter soli]|uniref:hypothetical protein n=1 Tax=Paucibacter soli TaxID=3133433 RepID=UPI0030AB889F